MSKTRKECFKAIDKLYGKTDAIKLYIEQLEADKAELQEFVKDINKLAKLNPDRLSDFGDIICLDSDKLLNKYKGE